MRIYAETFREVLTMELERRKYLQKLIAKKDNGRVKIVTGIRRCGKSYLLFELYTKYLYSEKNLKISSATIGKYLGYFSEAFLLSKAERYDVKGKKYIKTPAKYYFTDVGLRNAKLGFRQQEETHIMENVLYCDLLRRGFDVDVGVVEYNYKKEDGNSARVQLEIDFVVNRGNQRYYIQSALSIADPEKRAQEINPLTKVPDSFRKIVVVGDRINPWKDDNGILYIGIEKFLLDEKAIDM